MILCSDKQDECYPICDFCKHYLFDIRTCAKHGWVKQPDDECGDFHCYTVNEGESE